ncbi:MAG: hypothetical protein ABI481_02155 [Pyrinomonadaceae bacterium]
MIPTKGLYIAIFLILLAGTNFGQAGTRFTSAYTSLGAGCKTLSGKNGTDDASLCRGVGGYQIRVYGSAALVHINAEMKGEEGSESLATLSVDFNESKTRVEWRLANGKPFAVILRVPKYGDPTDDNPYFGKVVGEQLIIRGLKGYEIDLAVDAKTANANAKARELADKAYSEPK